MRWITFIVILFFHFNFFSQKISRLDTVGLSSLSPNVYNAKLFADSLSSSFCIVIKKEVKPHKHLKHSEHIVVLEGEGEMTLNKESFKIMKGDLVFIPANSIHSVKTLSNIPLKVLSIQAPYFDGKDRVMVEER